MIIILSNLAINYKQITQSYNHLDNSPNAPKLGYMCMSAQLRKHNSIQ